VGQLPERALVRLPHVVDETANRSERGLRLRDELVRRTWLRQIGDDAERGTRVRPRAFGALWIATADRNARALRCEHPRGLEPDAGRGAGHEAHAIAKPQVHAATLPA